MSYGPADYRGVKGVLPPLLEGHGAISAIFHECSSKNHTLINTSGLLAVRISQFEQSEVVFAQSAVVVGDHLRNRLQSSGAGRVEDLDRATHIVSIELQAAVSPNTTLP